MTILEELSQPSVSFNFHPFSKGSTGLGILQDYLRRLSTLKTTDEAACKALKEEIVGFCADIFAGKPLGLALDIISCESCRAKFLAFYAATLGIAAGRDFIAEVIVNKETTHE